MNGLHGVCQKTIFLKMGNQTIAHGRILINAAGKAKKYLSTLANDNLYPWVNREMFNLSYLDSKYFYDQHAIGFSATYKNLDGGVDLELFVLNIESILANLDFETAKIQIETEIMGTYDFFWLSKNHSRHIEDKDMLIENKSWYFGMGHRNMWGQLLHELKEPFFPYDFNYPIKFNEKIKKAFNLLLEETQDLGKGSVIYLKGYLPEKIIASDYLIPILMYFKIKRQIDFTYKDGLPNSIVKLKDMEKVPMFCIY